MVGIVKSCPKSPKSPKYELLKLENIVNNKKCLFYHLNCLILPIFLPIFGLNHRELFQDCHQVIRCAGHQNHYLRVGTGT